MFTRKLQLIKSVQSHLIVRHGSRLAKYGGLLVSKESKSGKPSGDRKLPHEPTEKPIEHNKEWDTPYLRYDKEAREWYTHGLVISKMNIGDNRMRPYLEIDPNAEPFKSIYQDDTDSENFTQVEVVTDPKAWYWVDRLLPNEKVMTPVVYKEEGKSYPTGWTAPSKQPPSLSYFVPRTRNRLLPVYKVVVPDEYAKPLVWGTRRPRDAPLLPIPFPRKDPISFKTLTVVDHVEGDCRQLEEDLRGYLEQKHKKKILSAVIEGRGKLHMQGNYVEDAAKWLTATGF